MHAAALLVAALAAQASADECLLGSCPAQGDVSSLMQLLRSSHHGQQPFPFPPDDGPVVPDGSQLARPNTSVAKATGGGKCPPSFGFPAPPDGLGLGYQLLEKELQGQPGRRIPGPPFEACSECASCPYKATTVYTALILNYRDGNSTLLNQLFKSTLKWSVIGYGATSQGCFGHTYTNTTETSGEANMCYSFAARLSDIFKPNKVEDIIVDSCGNRAMVRLFCGNCMNTTTRPGVSDYPQRYSWMFEIEDNESAPLGFYITKLDALLDTELTTEIALESYEVDPYVCSVFKGPPAVYPPPPRPPVNRVELPELDTNTTCEKCTNCSTTMQVLEPALLSFAKGDYGPLRKLLCPKVSWFVPGQGATLAACAAAQYQGSWAPFTGRSSFFTRLKAMTKSSKYIQSQLYLNYCGQKANFVWWAQYTGKSGFTYTMSMLLTMRFEPDRLSSSGFTITHVVQGFDTEVFLNMASREVHFDSMKCDKVGPFAQAISRSPIQA